MELPIRYWLQGYDDRPQNFGDYFSEIIASRVSGAPIVDADAYHLVGSVIDEMSIRNTLASIDLGPDEGKIAFWGCGLRSRTASIEYIKDRSVFCGVRGPITRDLLGLPSNTPIGDPAIILPKIFEFETGPKKGPSVCLVHYLDRANDEDLRVRSGADVVRRASIDASIGSFKALLTEIVDASFVLTGALHGAVAAYAYDIPFAYFDSGYIDCPLKWEDFSRSIGIETVFAKTIEEGLWIYDRTLKEEIVRLPLAPILDVCPLNIGL